MENASSASPRALAGRPLKRLNKALIYVIVTFLAAVILVPFFWMVSTALQADGDIFAWPPQWIPSPPQWHNFVEAWTAMPFNRYLFNTIFIVVLGIIAELASATLSHMGLHAFVFPGAA